MSHLPFTVFAYFLNSVAVLIDKVLLTKDIKDPLTYIFYLSAFNLLALIVLPFTQFPTFSVFFLASSSTLIWTTGAYFMYKALQIGRAERVIPTIGTLIPITLISYYGIFTRAVSIQQLFAAAILTLGLVLLILPYLKSSLKPDELIFEILSAILFAVSYMMLREAYLNSQFLTVFAWSRVILIPIGVIILAIPSLRRIVLTSHGPKLNFRSKTGVLFLLGQFCGGSSELLLTYSVFLANPAVVNSLQGTQYIFIFMATLLLSKKLPSVFHEHFSKRDLIGKMAGILVIGLGLYILATKSPHL